MRCVRSVVHDDGADAQCQKEQDTLGFSLAVLHNKTKEKIHGMKERLNQTEETVCAQGCGEA